MKKTVYIVSLCCLLMITSVFAAVTRQVNGAQITYTVTGMSTSYTKAYWSTYDVLAAGCTVSSVSCGTGNLGCSYVSSDRSIRTVGFTPEAGGIVPQSIVVTVAGAGSCLINSGQYVQSYTGASGTAQSLVGNPTLTLTACNTPADGIVAATICDGCVSDTEFPYAVNSWKQQTGIISDSIFPQVVTNWKGRNGC